MTPKKRESLGSPVCFDLEVPLITSGFCKAREEHQEILTDPAIPLPYLLRLATFAAWRETTVLTWLR